MCPVCSKFVSTDEIDLHIVMCLTKPRVTYNGKTANSTPRLFSFAELVLVKGRA